MDESTLSVDDFEQVGDGIQSEVDQVTSSLSGDDGGSLRSSTRSSVSRISGGADGSFVGEVDAGPSENDLLRIMECPVCAEFPIPPIYNCSNGHFTCNECISLLTACSLCEAKFTKVRNYALESIIESTKFKCRYSPQGCKDKIGGADYRNHLELCAYGPAICDEKKFTICEGKAIERVNYLDHLYLCHNAKGVKFDNASASKRLVATFLQIKGDDFSPIYMTSISTGQSFFVFTKKYKSFYCWWVASFKPQDTKASIAKLTWSVKDTSALTEDEQITEENQSDETDEIHPYSVQWTLPIHSLKKPFDEIRDSGLCAVLPDTHMQPFNKTRLTASSENETSNTEWNLSVEVFPAKQQAEDEPFYRKFDTVGVDWKSWLESLRLIFPLIALVFMIIGIGLLGAIYMKTSPISSTEDLKTRDDKSGDNNGLPSDRIDDMKPYPHLDDYDKLGEEEYEGYRGFYYNRNQKAGRYESYGSGGGRGKKYQKYGKGPKGIYGSGAPEHDDEFVGYRGFYHQKNTDERPNEAKKEGPQQEQPKIDTEPKAIAIQMIRRLLAFVGNQVSEVLGIKRREGHKKPGSTPPLPTTADKSFFGIQIEELDFVGVVLAKLFFVTFSVFCLIFALVGLTMYKRWIYSSPREVRRNRQSRSSGIRRDESDRSDGPGTPSSRTNTSDDYIRHDGARGVDSSEDSFRRRPTSY